jgi:hypothetical protein
MSSFQFSEKILQLIPHGEKGGLLQGYAACHNHRKTGSLLLKQHSELS